MYHTQTNVSTYSGPYYRTMTDDQCRHIHEASLEILEHTGVHLYYQPAIDLLKKAGCAVEGNNIHFPPHLVEWALRAAPSQIMMYDRSGNPVMPLGDRKCTYGTGSDCINVLDHRTRERREATLQDVVDGVRVAQDLSHVDFIMSMFVPSDVPVAAEVRQMEVMLLHSSKPICFVTYGWEGVPEIVEMLEAAMGREERLKAKPTAIGYLNPTNAFEHNEEALRKLFYFAERGLPFIYLPDVMRGMNGPYTREGAMACSNTGVLVGLVIAQLINEGAPTILSTARPSLLDMKTLIQPYGTGSGKVSGIDVNHYYDLPAFSTGGATDSKLLDEQAIFEATLSLYGSTLAGGNMIHDLGYMESGKTGSLELLVIEDEIVSWIKAKTKGLEINEENLAMDLIHEHALSGDFLGTDHTLRHVGEGWEPRLLDRQNYSDWSDDGGTSMRERAQEKVDKILEEEPQDIVSTEIAERIKNIADKAVTKYKD